MQRKLDKYKSKPNKACFGCLWDGYFMCSSIGTTLDSYSIHPAKQGKSGRTVRSLQRMENTGGASKLKVAAGAVSGKHLVWSKVSVNLEVNHFMQSYSLEILMDQFWCHHWRENEGGYFCFVGGMRKYRCVDKRLPRSGNSNLHENRLLKFMRATVHCSKTQRKTIVLSHILLFVSFFVQSQLFYTPCVSIFVEVMIWSKCHPLNSFWEVLFMCTREQSNGCHLSGMILLNLYVNQCYCRQMKVTAVENYKGLYTEDRMSCMLQI